MTVELINLPAPIMDPDQWDDEPRRAYTVINDPNAPRGPQWFKLSLGAKAVELLLKSLGQRYMFSTALTTRLQIEQLLIDDHIKR